MIKYQNALELEHFEIHSDKKFYCAHPHLKVTEGGYWVLIFNKSPRAVIDTGILDSINFMCPSPIPRISANSIDFSCIIFSIY